MRDIAQRAADTLTADGTEVFDVPGVDDGLKPGHSLTLQIRRASGAVDEVPLTCRIDTQEELGFYRYGGMLPQVYRKFVARIGAGG